MASKIEIKLRLRDADQAHRLMSDEFFTRYMKDRFRERYTVGSFYDTADGELAAANRTLRVRKINNINVADLKEGFADQSGFFYGEQWLCQFNGVETVLADFEERGAPHIEISSPLIQVRTFASTRHTVTLYMPDRVRMELSFDVNDDNSARMGLELLYGAGRELISYVDELRREKQI
ncbi:MAG: hypothetical protein LBT88_07595 [Oscillospiraceae bacterium]|jgi:inorganic triphosphatase YgiF|nr:hypothetical protein [Oscillospiraceae bacterium]